jgi:ADP-dependent NAD(P)H-hydrate dehydratase / NAD(P)H-hydrate epimerase
MEPWLEPVYDAEGMRRADRWAIDERGVPSLDLMEAAGKAVAEAASEVSTSERAVVVCGKGNNGGDGLVVARLLAQTGFEVDAVLLWPAGELSEDARANLDRFPDARQGDAELQGVLAGAGVVVDAIFGTGFEGAPRSPADDAIAAINACDAPVVATDIASGVNAASGEVDGAAVNADLTVTFHAAKLGHWIAPGKWHTGDLRVAPIGIPDGAPAQPATGLIGQGVLGLAPRRDARSTKFSSGQVVVVGGSRGLTGAVCLAATAAIRAGAGYATVAVPADLEPIFEAKLTEVMSVGCPGGDGRLGPGSSEAILSALERAAVVVLGPGLGDDEGAVQLARELAGRIPMPLVIDAQGLGAFSGRLELLAERDDPTILTPHAGELAGLLGSDSASVSARRLASAREAAGASGALVVLKGDDTLVVSGDRLAINGVPSPGLATAGTGDVLAGMIGALLARGMDAFAACCAGVLAHARAGRTAAEGLGGAESVIAGDLIEAIPAGLAT